MEARDRSTPGARAAANAPPAGPASAPARSLPRPGVLALIALNALLGLFAYRSLLAFQRDVEIGVEVEGWFFEPSDTSPPVVLLLAGWLFYRRWERLRALPRSRGGFGPLCLGLLLAGLAAFAWATAARAPDLLAVSLALNLLAFAALYAGAPAVRVLLLPAAFLLFAIPLPAPLLNEVVWRAQIWTAEYAGAILRVLGVPALISGDRIIRAGQSFEIIETCSGLRSVETLTMLAVLMVDLFRRPARHALLVIAAAPPVAFALNGLRAIALMANPHSDIATVHNLQGILILLGGLTLLYGLDGLLARLLDSDARGPSPPPAAPPRPRRGFGLALAAALSACAALSLWSPDAAAPLRPPALADAVPTRIGAFAGAEVETDRLFLGKVGFGAILHRRYRSPAADTVELFVGVHDASERLRSAFSPKTALPGSGWIVEDQGRERLASRDEPVEWRVVRSGTRRLLVYHWREGLGDLSSESVRTLLALDARGLRRSHPGVVVRLSTELPDLGEAARLEAGARLAEFAAALRNPLDSLQGSGA